MSGRLGAVCAVSVGLCLLIPAGALAVKQPSPGAASVEWRKAFCTDALRAIGEVKTTVRRVPTVRQTYYQEVKVQLDRRVIGGMWRQVDSRVYDWSRFRARNLPMWSRSAHRSGLASAGVSYTFKATVWLKQVRRGPDKTVWRYRSRSPAFTCADPSGIDALSG